jgi:succinyl-CoA synthetase beta subunit
MIEINPLGITIDGQAVLCDQKFNIDDNASFRQKALFNQEDLTQVKYWGSLEKLERGGGGETRAELYCVGGEYRVYC